MNYLPNKRNFLIFPQRLICLAAMICGLFSAENSFGQTNAKLAPIPVETTLRARQLRTDCPIDLSPDGAFVAYTVRDETRRTTETDDRFRTFSRSGVSSFAGQGNDVYVTDTKTGATQNITGGKGTSWTASWSPDGTTLAFYSDRDGAARIWLWNRITGNLRRASSAVARPLFANERILWTPDGKTILVKLLPENTTPEQAAELLTAGAVRETQEKSPGATVYVYRSMPDKPASDNEKSNAARTDAIHLFNRGLADFAALDVQSGKIERLAKNIHLRGFRLSPAGDAVALVTVRQIELNPPDNSHDLSVVSLRTKKTVSLQKNIAGLWTGEYFSWSPDGKFIAFNSFEPSKTSRILVFDAAREAQAETFDLPLAARPAAQSPLWDADSKNLFFIHSNAVWKVSVGEKKAVEFGKIPNRRLTEIVAPFQAHRFWSPAQNDSLLVKTFEPETLKRGFYRIDLKDGNAVAEIEKSENYGAAETIDASADNRKIAVVLESAALPPEIWTSDGGVKNLRRATRIETRLAEFVTGESRLIEYQTATGQKLRAALLLPAGYEAGKRYPLVTVVYGGANLSTRANDFGILGRGVNNLQLLATRGYAVLLPDLPTRGANVLQDLAAMTLPAVDRAIELGIADAERIGVMGHSFGGYTTLALITQTNRFKAAMMTAGFGNLFGLYGAMRDDGEAFNVQWWETGPHGFGDTPWKARDKYLENSPIFRLDKVQTPLFIAHGSRDVSVQPFLSDEIFVGLRRLGRETVYAKYENEGHTPAQWGYANQLDYATRMIDWFDAHLKRN
jgi:dipeptidyl aminopeptidase/acylaminoacyl peptidase